MDCLRIPEQASVRYILWSARNASTIFAFLSLNSWTVSLVRRFRVNRKYFRADTVPALICSKKAAINRRMPERVNRREFLLKSALAAGTLALSAAEDIVFKSTVYGLSSRRAYFVIALSLATYGHAI